MKKILQACYEPSTAGGSSAASSGTLVMKNGCFSISCLLQSFNSSQVKNALQR